MPEDTKAATRVRQGAGGALDRYFHLSAKGTSVKQELIAGLTSFVSVAYIIAVVPAMLADAGMPRDAAVVAVAVSAACATMLMGLFANFPAVVAPGLGLSAFFAYFVVPVQGLSWQAGLGAVFVSGVCFFLLTVTRLRQMLVDAVPMPLKRAIVVGIGLFITFIGLRGAGIVVASPSTLVTLGNFCQPGTLISFAGLLLTAVLMHRGWMSAMLSGMLATAAICMIAGVSPAPATFRELVHPHLPDLAPLFCQLDFKGAMDFGIVQIVFTFTIVELFDNMGTLIGLAKKAALMDEKGNIQNLDKAFATDSVGTMASAFIGCPTVTTYIESAAGIAQGARTGLSSVFAGSLFLLALPLAPLFSLVPAYATAPVLVIVGAIMMAEVVHIDFTDLTEGLPCFLTIATMPLTYSIATGFGFGFVSYAFLKCCTGRWRDVGPVMWVVSLLFVVNFALR
jgi:AGZA family xanthine/uracil permease-like MFS transporter